MKFWRLAKPESLQKRAWWAEGENKSERIICPVYDGHRRGGKRLTDLSVELPNLPVDDIVWTWYSECLIQDHVLDLFRREGLTGFVVKPVKVRFKKWGSKYEVPILWELVLTGWAGMAPPESGIRLEKSCDACGYKQYTCFTNPGALIKESQWDGSDFFMVWPIRRFIFITDRAAKVIKENKLTGARIIAPEKLTCVAGASPGRLSGVMPEAFARKYGEPLGIY